MKEPLQVESWRTIVDIGSGLSSQRDVVLEGSLAVVNLSPQLRDVNMPRTNGVSFHVAGIFAGRS